MAVGQQPLLLDSNIIIGIANGTINVSLFDDFYTVISAVTIMELYALAGMSQIEEQKIDAIASNSIVIPITAVIAKQAGVLARTRKNHKMDLLIAASALTLNVPVCTRNRKDFKNIPGIKTISI